MIGERRTSARTCGTRRSATSSTVVERTTSGLPLVTVNRFECGNVVVVTSPFFLQVKDRDAVPPKRLALLEQLQRETLPVQVEGLCEAMYNVWRAFGVRP